MIDVVVPIVSLSLAPTCHFARKHAPEVAHEYVKTKIMSLQCCSLAALNDPGVSRVAHSVLKVDYVQGRFICYPV